LKDTEEFLKAIRNRKPRVKKEIVFRLYYEGTKILFMQSGPEDQEWPEGDWISITRKEYDETRPSYNMIIDGMIAKPLPMDTTWIQLEKADNGPFTTLKDNMIFVADEGDKYRVKDYYELLSDRD
jgi:hypothetical protein